MKKRKFALVLSGGGFKGAFQLGALNYIQKNWEKITGLTDPMKFDVVAGVSVGALNGALVSMNELERLNELWLRKIALNGVSEIYTSEFIDTASKDDKIKLKVDLKQLAKRLMPDVKFKLNFFNTLGMIFSRDKRKKVIDSIIRDIEKGIEVHLPKFRSIASNTPLRLKLEKYLDRKKIKGTDFLCGFVSLDTGKYHGVMHNDFASEADFVHGVLASTAIPMVWEPVDRVAFQSGHGLVESKNNVDGGLQNVSPLGDVIKRINQDPDDCEYKIIIINCSSGILKQEDFSGKSIAAIAARSLYDIAITEIFNNDLGHFVKVNDIVKQAQAWDENIQILTDENRPLKSFDAVIINPHKDIELGSPLVANEKLIQHRLLHGATMAQLAFENKDFNNG